MRACPYCAEQIQDAAILCRFCGKSVTPVATPATAGLPAMSGSFESRLIRNAILTLLLVVMGIALLYAYRTQSPTGQIVSYDRAVSEIQSGQVRVVTINSDTATIEKADKTTETVSIGSKDNGALQRVVTDYNATVPSDRRITLIVQSGSQRFGIIGSALLILLPVLLVGGLFFYMLRQASRRP